MLCCAACKSVNNACQIAATRPDLSLGAVLDQLQQSASVGHSTDERRLLHWHLANLEFANASQLHQISAQQWDQDDEYAFVGPHCMVCIMLFVCQAGVHESTHFCVVF